MEAIDAMLQKGHSSYQKYHLTKIASHKNGISRLTLLVFWSNTNTLLIEATPTIRHKLENTILKSLNHGFESCNKDKNSLLNITQITWQISFGHFFTRCATFARHHFLWLGSYLSILGGVFDMCHCCKWHYFQMALRGAISAGCCFYLMYLMVLFDFLYLAMYIKNIP